jgi:hypothetical protein
VLELGKKPDVVHANLVVVEVWHAKVKEYQRGMEKIFYFLWNLLHAKLVIRHDFHL